MTEPNPPEEGAKFGTFTGVFTPTLLTILGVIMYVRMGWVVGNAGLGGAIGIVLLGLLITTCTGLSLSSIATNTRIGNGGPYAIMNRSLGKEVAGAIGIPLYLTRPLGVAMYIFGFREGIQWIWPNLPSLPIDLAVFAGLFAIAFRSADLAFKTQYVIMGVIGLSLISIFASSAPIHDAVPITWWGDYPGEPTLPGDPDSEFVPVGFWGVFAVFFPATTGILAGANMSGDLINPRRSIPKGTLSAIALSAVLYLAVAVWCARTGELDELARNYNHLIDHSLFPTLVLAGLLGATASSALAGLVGGPRILMAMGENGIIPWSDTLAKKTSGEPRAAIAVTGVLTLLAIATRDLNAIAPLVTMFFLITYAMVNFVVILEQGLGLVSFRPTLRVPTWVPVVGFVGSLMSMFIISPSFGWLSVLLVIGSYAYMRSRGNTDPVGTDQAQSAVFLGLASWAASKVTQQDRDNARAWKPHLLIPVQDPDRLERPLTLLHDLAHPEGSLQLLGVSTHLPVTELQPRLASIGLGMEALGHRVSWTTIDSDDLRAAVTIGTMALQGAFFRPNLLAMQVPAHPDEDATVAKLVRSASDAQVGVILLGLHERTPGRGAPIRLWVRPGPDWDVAAAFERASLDLALLMGFRLWRVWGGDLIVTVVAADRGQSAQAAHFLDELCELARFPDTVKREVLHGSFHACLQSCDAVGMSLFGLQREAPDMAWARTTLAESRGSCLFVLDSDRESAQV